jgi:flagellar biosynthesis/type III secretory pathway protein FliH
MCKVTVKEYTETTKELDLEYNKYAEYSFEKGFLTGYEAAIEKVKEYLFNTEEHQNKEGKFYISEEYLKQTIKFLNYEK